MTAAAVTDFIGFSFSGRATDCVKDRVVIQADLLSRSAGGRSRPACPKRDYSIEGTKERTGAEGGRGRPWLHPCMHVPMQSAKRGKYRLQSLSAAARGNKLFHPDRYSWLSSGATTHSHISANLISTVQPNVYSKKHGTHGTPSVLEDAKLELLMSKRGRKTV